MGRRNTIGESLSSVEAMSDEAKPDPKRIRRVWRQFWLSIMLHSVGVSILVLSCSFALSGPAATPDSKAWSMYRSDPEDPARRVHVATFHAGPFNDERGAATINHRPDFGPALLGRGRHSRSHLQSGDVRLPTWGAGANTYEAQISPGEARLRWRLGQSRHASRCLRSVG
jgi:hypothetical protein